MWGDAINRAPVSLPETMSDIEKRFYKIREVAEMLELPASTLRFWETQFTALKPKRTAHSTRQYTPQDVETLRMIKYLVKDRGLKLDAARDEMRRNRSGVSRRFEAVKRLTEIRNKLDALRQTLDARLLAQHRAARAARASRAADPGAPTSPPTLF